MKELTKAEETILLAIWRLGNDAYGVTIKNQIKKTTKREYLYSTLYTTLEQLVSKGFIDKRFGEPMLDLDDKNIGWILSVIRDYVEDHSYEALLIEDSAIRGILAQIVMLEFPHVPVLSMDELNPEFEENIIKII